MISSSSIVDRPGEPVGSGTPGSISGIAVAPPEPASGPGTGAPAQEAAAIAAEQVTTRALVQAGEPNRVDAVGSNEWRGMTREETIAVGARHR
jgi:hypothetical protein